LDSKWEGQNGLKSKTRLLTIVLASLGLTGILALRLLPIPVQADPDPPTVDSMVGPATGYRGDTITITATASDPEDDNLTFEWKIDNEAFPNQTNETFTFTIVDNPIVVGSHTIYVRAKDLDGLFSDWMSMAFTTLNHAPTVSSVGPVTGYRDQAYTFTATGSDIEGDNLTYEWYVDGVLESTEPNLTHIFGSSDAIGEHTISVRVQDALGDYSIYNSHTFTLEVEIMPYYRSFTVNYEEDVYVVETFSNSTLADLTFNQEMKRIRFNVTGNNGTESFCNITIPIELLSGDFTVFMDDLQLEESVDYTFSSNSTHNTLSISYEHSSHVIEVFGTNVIPDFPGQLLLPFAMLATLLTLALAKIFKKQKEH